MQNLGFFRSMGGEDMKTKHAFIAAHASEHAIRFMCRVLGVAHSLFHARRRAAPKSAARAARRDRLGAEIREIFEQSKRCYGAPRIHAELKARGLRISKRSVVKLSGRTAFVHREAGGGRRSPPTAATPMRSRPICSTATSKPLRPMRLWCMEPRWCDRPFPGWLADPDCVWFRRTDRAIVCVDLHGDFGLLGLECASGELAAVEPLGARDLSYEGDSKCTSTATGPLRLNRIRMSTFCPTSMSSTSLSSKADRWV